MWHRADVVLTDVSEELIASIFKVEGKIRKSATGAKSQLYESRKGRDKSTWEISVEGEGKGLGSRN
jgi:hypothetical protein